jgi:hypothetical protein
MRWEPESIGALDDTASHAGFGSPPSAKNSEELLVEDPELPKDGNS